MTAGDPIHGGLPGVGGARPIDGPASGTPKSVGAPEGGAAFKALLEKLEVQARQLSEASDAVSSPEALAGAVDRARESIEEAVSLGDELLEAYRAARQQSETGETSGDTNED